jgi:hypothetical protein
LVGRLGQAVKNRTTERHKMKQNQNKVQAATAPVSASVVLCSGRTIAHTEEPNGSQRATPTTGPEEMTESEWQEYCQAVLPRPLKAAIHARTATPAAPASAGGFVHNLLRGIKPGATLESISMERDQAKSQRDALADALCAFLVAEGACIGTEYGNELLAQALVQARAVLAQIGGGK